MLREITFKKQGNGQDSWVIKYPNNPEMMPEIVYTDPSIPVEHELVKMVKSMSQIERDELKALLK